jgi:hypothetical protein
MAQCRLFIIMHKRELDGSDVVFDRSERAVSHCFDLSHTLLDVGMVALVGVGILFSIRLHSRLVFIRLSCLSLCLLGGFCNAAGIVFEVPCGIRVDALIRIYR